MNYTTKQLEAYSKFEVNRTSGLYKLLDLNARQLTRLEDYMTRYVITNYKDLNEANALRYPNGSL